MPTRRCSRVRSRHPEYPLLKNGVIERNRGAEDVFDILCTNAEAHSLLELASRDGPEPVSQITLQFDRSYSSVRPDIDKRAARAEMRSPLLFFYCHLVSENIIIAGSPDRNISAAKPSCRKSRCRSRVQTFFSTARLTFTACVAPCSRLVGGSNTDADRNEGNGASLFTAPRHCAPGAHLP